MARIILGVIFCSLAPIFILLAFTTSPAWAFAVPFVGFPAFIGGCAIMSSSRYFDANAIKFENVLCLIRAHADDWKIVVSHSGGAISGRLYSLHGLVRVWVPETYGDLDVTITSPDDPNDSIRYTVKSEYNDRIRDACQNLRDWKELKRFVSVSLYAKENADPVDKARKAIEDFSARKGIREETE